MANKHIYAKSASGISDFVYVDLLPEVKRSRQFNMNVIGALFLGVFLSYVLIYMPFRAATEQYETLNPRYSENIIPLKQAKLKVDASDIIYSSKYNISRSY